MHILDFEGQELSIGDTVVFAASPFALQRGIVTGLIRKPRFIAVEVVITFPDGHTATMTPLPNLCAKQEPTGK